MRQFLAKLLGLERELRELKGQVRELQWDTAFDMWTRAAFLQLCRLMPRGERTIAFIDLDDIHGLNHSLGYTEVDRRIRETFALQLRSSDIVARWYSGDEIVILFDSDSDGAKKKIADLERRAKRHDLSFVWDVGSWDVGRQDVVDIITALGESSRSKQPDDRESQRGRKRNR